MNLFFCRSRPFKKRGFIPIITLILLVALGVTGAASVTILNKDKILGVNSGSPPIGSWDGLQNDACRIDGWTVDPDTPSTSIQIHAYRDGVAGSGGTFINVYTADAPRSDINQIGYPGNHGFVVVFDTKSGLRDGKDHQLYVYAIDSANPDRNTLLGNAPRTIKCPAASQGNVVPIGSFDGVTNESCYISGWTADPDTPSTSTPVHVYRDGPTGGGGTFIGQYYANQPRPDINQIGYPGNHGFAITLDASSSLKDGKAHSIYVYGIDSAGGPAKHLDNSPKTANCAAAKPSPPADRLPIGSFDGVHNNSCYIDGWALDPDTPSTNISVHVYRDNPAGSGALIGGYQADIPRADVNSATGYPGNHGFGITFDAKSGLKDGKQHTLYVYGINSANNNKNTQLSISKTITCSRISPPSYQFNLVVNTTTAKGGTLQLAGVKVTIDLTEEAKASMKKEGLPIPEFVPQITNNEGQTEFSGIPKRNYYVTISKIPEGYKIADGEKNPQLKIPANDKDTVSFKIVKKDDRPNIIVIMTDDQRWDTLQFMPNVQQELVNKGMNFTNYFTVSPLCCPSRASFLTGLYPHNHGIKANEKINGGGAFYFKDNSTIATWLKSAGYKTSMVGKYFNEYDLLNERIPPGWDDWHVFTGGRGSTYFNFKLNENGTVNHFCKTEANEKNPLNCASLGEYSTDTLKNRTIDFIKKHGPTPFFLVMTPFAPHTGSTVNIPPEVAPRHSGSCDDLSPSRPPSLNEKDVSDKQKSIQERPLLSEDMIKYLDFLRKTQVCSLKAVDEAVGEIITALGDEIDNTMIVFTSDNGYLLGEHRLIGKNCEFDECIRLPLVIRYPRIVDTAKTINKFALNIDLAPTFAEIAKTTPASKVNGKSLLSLLTDSSTPWRGDFLVEFGLNNAVVRNGRYTYGELAGGARVLYDNQQDSYQLNNLLGERGSSSQGTASVVEALSKRLQTLKTE